MEDLKNFVFASTIVASGVISHSTENAKRSTCSVPGVRYSVVHHMEDSHTCVCYHWHFTAQQHELQMHCSRRGAHRGSAVPCCSVQKYMSHARARKEVKRRKQCTYPRLQGAKIFRQQTLQAHIQAGGKGRRDQLQQTPQQSLGHRKMHLHLGTTHILQ